MLARQMAPYMTNYGGGIPTAARVPRDDAWIGRSFGGPQIRRFTIAQRDGRLVVIETD